LLDCFRIFAHSLVGEAKEDRNTINSKPITKREALAALLLVTEHDGPTMFARIGVMRALNRHVKRVFDTSRKD
jgi:hypothetical protein